MNVQTYIALGLLVISIAFYLSIPYQVAKPKLLFGRAVMDMGSDLFPRIAAIGLAAASVMAFIQGLVAPEKNPFKDIIPRARRDIGYRSIWVIGISAPSPYCRSASPRRSAWYSQICFTLPCRKEC